MDHGRVGDHATDDGRADAGGRRRTLRHLVGHIRQPGRGEKVEVDRMTR